MTDSRLHYLMQRYLSQDCNSYEKDELASLIASLHDEDLKKQLQILWDTYDRVTNLPEDKSQRILSNILSERDRDIQFTIKRKKRFMNVRTFTAAASVLLLVSLGIYLKHNYVNENSSLATSKQEATTPDKQTHYIRNITLPDGSLVVLQAGSTIYFPQKFSGNLREVTLKGEAYFDVVHNSAHPFLIHTGNVKTTVLGTAFNIKAWPGEKDITVSVTRGKVKVEDSQKVLAVLTADQQIQYNIPEAVATQQTVTASKIVTDWTKQDMNFDGVTMESIVRILSKRYGVIISISDPKLGSTLVVSSFSGTESLQNILDILCTINSNTRQIVNGNEIILTYK